MTLKYRAMMIVGVALGTILLTWFIATVSEWLLRDGLVRYVALVLFLLSTIISCVGLGLFLRNSLAEWARYHERNGDVLSIDNKERVLVRFGHNIGDLRMLDEHSGVITVIPARYKPPIPLDEKSLDSNLVQQLLNGGNPYDRQSPS
jgi:hypothetical protein